MLCKSSIALERHNRTVRFFKLEGSRGMTRDVIFRRVDRRVARAWRDAPMRRATILSVLPVREERPHKSAQIPYPRVFVCATIIRSHWTTFPLPFQLVLSSVSS